ncbi:MAG: 16S rRNA (guanine(966)-N(2))-methyltransferase RsmD [bacterium]
MHLKITSGFLKTRIVRTPATSLRPTCEKVRAAFFNALFSLIDFEDRAFLDIFSGSGVLAFEAVSRGFSKASAIEIDEKAVKQIKFSAEELGLSSLISVIRENAFTIDFNLLKGEQFSAIYIDPPYTLGEKMASLLDKIVSSDIIHDTCVICVEGESVADWSRQGWSSKNKKFGDTFLTFFYNWGN